MLTSGTLQGSPTWYYKKPCGSLRNRSRALRCICFVSFVVSKHIELQTDVSIKRYVDEAKKIVDA